MFRNGSMPSEVCSSLIHVSVAPGTAGGARGGILVLGRDCSASIHWTPYSWLHPVKDDRTPALSGPHRQAILTSHKSHSGESIWGRAGPLTCCVTSRV